jgi:hypothetical protein
VSAFRRLSDHDKSRIAAVLNQTDPPSAKVIGERFGIHPVTVYKMINELQASGGAMDTGSRKIVVNSINWFAYPGRDHSTKHILYVAATGGEGTPIKSHEDILGAAAQHGTSHVMFGMSNMPAKAQPMEKVTPKLTSKLFRNAPTVARLK